jgi:hypothetical protein
MKAAGYALVHRFTGRSWQGELANQVMIMTGVRLADGPEVVRKEDYRTGHEEVHVTYLPAPEGPLRLSGRVQDCGRGD